MPEVNKKSLNEAEIRTRYITPAITSAGWDLSQLREEFFYFTNGRIEVRGKTAHREKRKKVDYLLFYAEHLPLAIVEAKDNNHGPGAGMQQAIAYAEALDVPFVFTSNGDSFMMFDRTGLMYDVETEIVLNEFPHPEQLYAKFKLWKGLDDDTEKLIASTYHFDDNKKPRYYQRIAINRAIEAIAKNRKRILVVMATGTGKTYVAAQIIWRFWKNSQDKGRQKRILFLADRDILVQQPKLNDFKHFGTAMTRISNRKIDKSFEVYLSLYQSVTGTDEALNIYKQFNPEFFNLIVVDECHRGSARDNSAWREILEYFSSAVQVGMTATPKETKDVSNIDYFGEPIYTYSLRQGIDDGFLAPYKVIRVALDLDTFNYRPDPGTLDADGNMVPDKEYKQKDFDRSLVLPTRTQLVAERVTEFLEKTDPFAKTIIFCQDIDHARRMRHALVNLNADRVRENSKYIMQITGDEEEGRRELDNFIDPQSRYPVIATTSELLSTGVDAQTCKVIVLDSNIESMTKFKQIIGRGTRVREEYGKMWFTIIDFRNVTKLFADPDFDGDPVRIMELKTPEEFTETVEDIENEDVDETPGEGEIPLDNGPEEVIIPEREPTARPKITINGVPIKIIGERIQYLDGNGKLITEQLTDYSKRTILDEYATLKSFLHAWNLAQRRTAILDELIDKGIPLDDLQESVGTDIDLFDLVLHVAYDKKPIKRRNRADTVKKSNYLKKYEGKAREVLETLLDKYTDTGLGSIEDMNTLKVQPFNEIGTELEIIELFGGRDGYLNAVRDMEQCIYQEVA